MILLDSNTLIYLSKGLLNIDEVLPDNEVYAVSVVSYMEVMGYTFESSTEEAMVKKLFDYFTLLMIDSVIANKVIELRKAYKIKLPDAIICATAIHYKAKLLTNDEKLQQISELDIRIIKPQHAS